METGAVKSFFGFTGLIIVLQIITYWLIGFIFFATGIHTMVYFQNYPDPVSFPEKVRRCPQSNLK